MSIETIRKQQELPKFKDYTINEKLKQFRKVDHDEPSIDFVDFNSEEGLRCRGIGGGTFL